MNDLEEGETLRLERKWPKKAEKGESEKPSPRQPRKNQSELKVHKPKVAKLKAVQPKSDPSRKIKGIKFLKGSFRAFIPLLIKELAQ